MLSEIAEGEHNAVWRLFSYDREVVLEAKQQYHVRQPDMSTIVQQLFEIYQREKFDMAYTVEDFQKDYVREHLDLLSPDDRLLGLSPDEVLKHFSPDDIVKHLSRTDLEKLMEKLQKNFPSRK